MSSTLPEGGQSADAATTPILPRMGPDPSVYQVGGDFFLANSSFEYSPGVPVWHSRDLVSWRQIGNALTRDEQFLAGCSPSSRGIYAPTLRHHGVIRSTTRATRPSRLRPDQRRDRRTPLRHARRGQDPRQPGHGQTRRPRPGPAGRHRLRDRPGAHGGTARLRAARRGRRFGRSARPGRAPASTGQPGLSVTDRTLPVPPGRWPRRWIRRCGPGRYTSPARRQVTPCGRPPSGGHDVRASEAKVGYQPSLESTGLKLR